MSKIALIHCGCHKTGSTVFQSLLKKNDKEILEEGLCNGKSIHLHTKEVEETRRNNRTSVQCHHQVRRERTCI